MFADSPFHPHPAAAAAVFLPLALCSIHLPVGSFVNAETAGISSTAGLIVFNNEMAQVEGLWQALRQEGGNIVWVPAATYQAVPYQHMAAGNALATIANINNSFCGSYATH
jgi:hypothetical protein